METLVKVRLMYSDKRVMNGAEVLDATRLKMLRSIRPIKFFEKNELEICEAIIFPAELEHIEHEKLVLS